MNHHTLVEEWCRTHLPANVEERDPFDLAADCAYSLDLCEECEINGDRTFIPAYIIAAAEKVIAENSE